MRKFLSLMLAVGLMSSVSSGQYLSKKTNTNNTQHELRLKSQTSNRSMNDIEAGLTSINNSNYYEAASAAAVAITGTIRNNGSDNITAFDVTYSIDGVLHVQQFLLLLVILLQVKLMTLHTM